jgi:hypothetical protein
MRRASWVGSITLLGLALAPNTQAAVVRLELQPAALELAAEGEGRRVLVTGFEQDGSKVDLTNEAKFEPSGPGVTVDETGYMMPATSGKTSVTVTAGGQTAQLAVTVGDPGAARPASFVRDVMPIVNKTGCTQGACHGSAKGKNGFKLSLRGYDPDFDYKALLFDISGRRFNRADPAASLMLAKPAQEVPHEGGLRFEKGSRYYNTILNWIAEGVKFGDLAADSVKRLEVIPAEIFMAKPETKQQVLVLAHYADGSVRDVTREAVIESNSNTTAVVENGSIVVGERVGEAAMLVRYEGRFITIPVTILNPEPGFEWKQLSQYNFVDKHIDAKLQRLKIQPGETADDGVFVRRVYIDLIGIPPTPQEARRFLEDPDSQRVKRARLVDDLMQRKEFVDHWALKWGDLLQSNRKYLGEKGTWAFREWIRDAIIMKRPYNDMVRELLTSVGSTHDNPAANFFRVNNDPKEAMEKTTQLFLGVRMVCAQCHDHPFEKWTQNQYFQLSAFFAAVGVKPGFDSEEEIVY